MNRRLIPLIALAILCAACGSQLDEGKVRRAQTKTSDSVVQGSSGGTSTGDTTKTTTASSGAGSASGAGVTGSGGGTSGGGAPRATNIAPNDRTGATGGVVKVGGVFPLSGGLSALGRPVEQAARAYFRNINDTGGLGGQKIEFIAEDDGADPNRTRSAAEKLVERDHIFVMGPSFTPFSPDLVTFLEGKGVPFIGFDGVNVEGFKSASTVTLGASIIPHARVLVPYWYERTKAKRVGIIYLDVPPAVSYMKDTRDVICPKLGCQVVRVQPVQFTTTDYVSILLGMQQAQVNGIFIVTDPASAVKMLVQAKQLNYKPSPGGYLGQHGIYLDLVPNSCGAFCDGIIAPTSLFPPQVKSPATDEMRRIVSRYYSNVEYGYFTELGYVSARVLVDLIKRAGVPDRAKILDVARSLTSYDTGGFTNPAKPISLAPGAERERDIIIVKMQGGQWKQDSDWLPPRKF